MGRTKGSKNKNTEIIEDVTQTTTPVTNLVAKSGEVVTKLVAKSVIEPQLIAPKNKINPQIFELDLETDEEELDDTNDTKNRAEVILSKDFKVIVTKNNKELFEKYMTKKKNEDGTETDIGAWRSHGYPNTWKYISKCVREIISKNKMYDKGVINGFDELLKILKESDRKIDRMFIGLED